MKILICITELNYVSTYINYVLYIYVCIPLTSDTEKSKNSSHERYRTLNSALDVLKLSVTTLSENRFRQPIPLFHQSRSSAGSETEPSFKPVLCLSTPAQNQEKRFLSRTKQLLG